MGKIQKLPNARSDDYRLTETQIPVYQHLVQEYAQAKDEAVRRESDLRRFFDRAIVELGIQVPENGRLNFDADTLTFRLDEPGE